MVNLIPICIKITEEQATWFKQHSYINKSQWIRTLIDLNMKSTDNKELDNMFTDVDFKDGQIVEKETENEA